MSRRKKGRKANPRRTSNPEAPAHKSEVPQPLFDVIVSDLDALAKWWIETWPHGINPRPRIEAEMGSTVRAYRAGVRSKGLYEELVRIKDRLTLA